jgi:oxalate decarboxylase
MSDDAKKGTGKMTVFATGGRARTMDFQAGDVGYIEITLLHSIQNTGDTDLGISCDVQRQCVSGPCTVEVAHPHPPELVWAHPGIDKATLDAIPIADAAVMPKSSGAPARDFYSTVTDFARFLG